MKINKQTVSKETVDRFSAELKKIKQEDIHQNLLEQYFSLGE